jgi:hypothetical protein
LTVYVSTTSFESRDLDVILAACDEHRLDALELSSVDRYDLSRLGVTDYPSRFLVHNYFPPPAEPFVINLASQDSTLLQRSRAHCRAAIDLSSRLGGAVYAAHAGFTADVSPEILGKPERQAALAEDSLTTYDRAYANTDGPAACAF